METNRDEELWQLAKKRASFQRSLVSYFVINAFLWLIWWFTTDNRTLSGRTPWPVWAMLGWGLGLVFQYFAAYGGNKQTLQIRSMKNLKRKKKTILINERS